VPRWYWIPAGMRLLLPGLLRRGLARSDLATATSAKED
jgi:hypothetical protein